MSTPSVGLFDSGVDGLSVLRHALRTLAGAPLLYVADSAHAPYGDRDPGLSLRRLMRRRSAPICRGSACRP